MKQIIVIVGTIILAIALVALLTGPMQNSATNLINNTVTDIGTVNP